MTPQGSNLKKGSSPGSHHLGLLSEEKFGLARRLKTARVLGEPASFALLRDAAPEQGAFSQGSFGHSRAAAAEGHLLEGIGGRAF
jgi:uncharacterized protein (DUF1684 family)